jgi:hypothetical protein
MRIRKRKLTTLAATAATLMMSCVTVPRAGATEGQPSPSAQNPPVSVPAAAPAANPSDVGSIDAILHAAYDTISGPAGQQRDWKRFRSLFVAGARLIPVVPDP